MPERREPSESFASLFEQSAGAKRNKTKPYQVGDTLDVTIVAVTREAVFADLGRKQEGLFERNDLSDPDGNLLVNVGARVSATVGAIDNKTGQVRLHPIAVRPPVNAEPDLSAPAATVATFGGTGKAAPVLVEGARVKGSVTGIERYGVFVQIAGTTGRSGRGLIPASETGTPRGADLKKHFVAGQELEVKIVAIDESGKIRLSIAALKADEERGEFEAYAQAERTSPKTAGAEKPAVRGFGTLGDLLKKPAAGAEGRAKPAPTAEAKPAPGADSRSKPASGADSRSKPAPSADSRAKPASGADSRPRPAPGVENRSRPAQKRG
jgi:small subunit ribosomal protein S1